MMYDLYLALLDESNSRPHPVLLALLYSFCPAAAGWWIRGIVPPKPQFNIVWKVLEDYASEKTLAECIQESGIGDLVDAIKLYIDAVKDYRRQTPRLRAPELLPLFPHFGVETILGNRNHDAINKHFGGKPQNVFEYVRIWAFVLQDWMDIMADNRPVDITLRKYELAVQLPGTATAVSIPEWVWEYKVGQVDQPCIGLITDGGRQDHLRFLMSALSAPEPDHAWGAKPRIYNLDPLNGDAAYYEPLAPTQRMIDVVHRLAGTAMTGPYPPLGALNRPHLCQECPFHAQCFDGFGALSEAVVRLNNHSTTGAQPA